MNMDDLEEVFDYEQRISELEKTIEKNTEISNELERSFAIRMNQYEIKLGQLANDLEEVFGYKQRISQLEENILKNTEISNELERSCEIRMNQHEIKSGQLVERLNALERLSEKRIIQTFVPTVLCKIIFFV